MIEPSLPGAELVAEGLRDLERGQETVPALVVAIGAPRLRAIGLTVPDTIAKTDLELRLYDRLRRDHPRDAYGKYNALMRRLVSFEHAAEQRKESAARRS